MDANVIISLVGSLGFPIVACIGMAYFCSRIINNNREDIKEMNTIHRTEMDKITDAINNNSMVIQKLIDKLDKGGDVE